MSDFNTRTDGHTMFAETAPFTSEAESRYHNNADLVSDRHEDTHAEYQAAKESRPMSARSLAGLPVHDLANADLEKTVITVDGLEMSLAQGIRSGFVKRTANGYAEAGQKAAPAKPQKSQADPLQSTPLFAAKTEGFNVLMKMADSMGSLNAAENAFIKLIGARAHGKDATNAIRTIGDAVGQHTEDGAIDASNALIGELAGRVAQHLDAMGVDGTEALNYYITFQPTDASNRLVSLFRGHDVSRHLATIRNAYKRAKEKGRI